jgi:hypothetical protein
VTGDGTAADAARRERRWQRRCGGEGEGEGEGNGVLGLQMEPAWGSHAWEAVWRRETGDGGVGQTGRLLREARGSGPGAEKGSWAFSILFF